MNRLTRAIADDNTSESQQLKTLFMHNFESIKHYEKAMDDIGVTSGDFRAACISAEQARYLSRAAITNLGGNFWTPSGTLELQTYLAREKMYAEETVKVDREMANTLEQIQRRKSLLDHASGAAMTKLQQDISNYENKLNQLCQRKGDVESLITYHRMLVPVDAKTFFAKFTELKQNLDKLYAERSKMAILLASPTSGQQRSEQIRAYVEQAHAQTQAHIRAFVAQNLAQNLAQAQQMHAQAHAQFNMAAQAAQAKMEMVVQGLVEPEGPAAPPVPDQD